MNLIQSHQAAFAAFKAELIDGSLSLPPFYLPLNSRYYQCYFDLPDEDRSFVVELGKKPLLLVLICQAEAGTFNYYGQPVRFVWAEDISDKARQGANKVALKHLAKLTEGGRVVYHEQSSAMLSAFALSLLKQGYNALPRFDQQVDLNQSEEALFSDLRKIFRANVRWGLEQMEYRKLDAESLRPGDIEPFRLLHIDVAGGETRSIETWQLQEQMIAEGEAFALYGYLGDELVSTGLFPYSRSDCYYGVGAYQRSLFDKPISHALVWQAMLEAKRLGCRRFVFGETFFSGIDREGGTRANDKELAISHFKQGFGGQMVPQLAFVRNE